MEKQFTYHGSKIHYQVYGNGHPVVLLHGFGEDSHIWDEQIPILQDHCQLIIPDLPGSGRSEILSRESEVGSLELDGRSISIDDYADCMFHLLQFENLSKVYLLGHSMGGYITLAFAEKYPELLSGFGLVHSTAFADSTEKKENRDRGIQLIDQYGPHPFLKNTIPNLFGKQFKQDHPEKVEALIRAAEHFTGESLIQYLTAMKNRPDRTAVLLSNRLPVLFVIGTEDIAAPLEDLLQQINLPKFPHIHIMQNTGHMGMWENTLEMNSIMLDFIQRKN